MPFTFEFWKRKGKMSTFPPTPAFKTKLKVTSDTFAKGLKDYLRQRFPQDIPEKILWVNFRADALANEQTITQIKYRAQQEKAHIILLIDRSKKTSGDIIVSNKKFDSFAPNNNETIDIIYGEKLGDAIFGCGFAKFFTDTESSEDEVIRQYVLKDTIEPYLEKKPLWITEGRPSFPTLTLPKKTSDISSTPLKRGFLWKHFGLTLSSVRNWIALLMLTAIGACLLENLLPGTSLAILAIPKIIAVLTCITTLVITSATISNHLKSLEGTQKAHFKDREPTFFEAASFKWNHFEKIFSDWYNQSWRNKLQLNAGAILFGVVVLLMLVAISPGFQSFFQLLAGSQNLTPSFNVLFNTVNFLMNGTGLDYFGLFIFLPAVALTAYDVLCRIITWISPVRSESESVLSIVEDTQQDSRETLDHNSTQNPAAYEAVTSAERSDRYSEDRRYYQEQFDFIKNIFRQHKP